jgi:hypothetical protein
MMNPRPELAALGSSTWTVTSEAVLSATLEAVFELSRVAVLSATLGADSASTASVFKPFFFKAASFLSS